MAAQDAPRQSSFTLETLRAPIGGIGLAALLAGLASWLVSGEFGTAPRVLLAVAVLFIGVYVALNPEEVWSRFTGRGAMFTSNSLVVALAIMGILVLVNVLGSRYQTKWDLTADNRFTMTEQSRAVARTLPAPVQITGYFRSSDTSQGDFEALIRDFVQASGGMITYQNVDPEIRPAEAIANGVTQFGTIVYQMGEKKQNSFGTTEQDIATALVKLTRESKTVYFTIGHGERNIEGLEQNNYSEIKSDLERDNFTVETLNLTTQRTVPDDAAVVIVGGPTSPFLPEELDALKAYVDGGGKMFILKSPGSTADFSSVLTSWGARFSGNLVIEPVNAYLGDVRVPVADSYNPHPITQDLRLATIFPAVTDVVAPDQSPAGATITVLAESTDRSWGNTDAQQIRQQESDPRGPLKLAVAMEQTVTTGAEDSAASQTPERKSRVVLIGSADFVANQFLRVGAGNKDFFLNAANWLAEQDDLIAARPPDTVSRTMLLTGTQMNLVAYSSMLFLPLAVLLAGFAVWWSRR